jgi:hypothetical protein
LIWVSVRGFFTECDCPRKRNEPHEGTRQGTADATRSVAPEELSLLRDPWHQKSYLCYGSAIEFLSRSSTARERSRSKTHWETNPVFYLAKYIHEDDINCEYQNEGSNLPLFLCTIENDNKDVFKCLKEESG